MKLPQLSLRELFLPVALVAMGCGWWLDRSLLAEKLRESQRVIDGMPNPHPLMDS